MQIPIGSKYLLRFYSLTCTLKKFLFNQSNLWVSPFSSSTTKMISGRFLVTFTALLSIIPSSIGNLAAKRYKSTCETNPADIHLTKGSRVVILFLWYSLTSYRLWTSGSFIFYGLRFFRYVFSFVKLVSISTKVLIS